MLGEEINATFEQLSAVEQLSEAVARAADIEQVYGEALKGLQRALRADRSAILLFDADGVMRFKAWDGLSDAYRGAVEGHSPWDRDDPDPQPVLVEDVATEPSLQTLRDALEAERIRSVAFVPLTFDGKLLGKFMVNFDAPHRYTPSEQLLARTVANHVAFALARSRIENDLRTSRDQLEAVLRGTAAGITVQAPNGELLYANDTAAELIGYPSGRDLMRTPVGDVMSRFQLLDEDGNPMPPERLPGHRALSGKSVLNELVGWRTLPPGDLRWSMVSASPVFDEQGHVRFAINIFRDITERKLAEERLWFLARASELLAASLDLDATLANLAEITVPGVADWCLVDMLEEGGRIRQVAVAHRDPTKAELARELRRRFPPDWSRPHPITRVLASGKPELAPEMRDDELPVSHPEEAENARLLRELGVASHLVVPLVTRGRILGAISLVYGSSGRRYTDADLPFAEELARRAAVAIDNARLHGEVRSAARRADEAFAVLDSILRTAPVGLAFLDRDLRYVQVNDYLARLNGRPAREHIGRAPRELFPELAAGLDPLLEHVLETDQPLVDLELRERAPGHAEVRDWLVSFYPVHSRSGESLGIGAVVLDLSERKRNENVLRFQKSLLELQSEASLEGILVVDRDGRMVSFNRRFVEMWGIPAEVVESRSDDAALESVREKVADPDAFLARVAYLYEHTEEESRDELELTDGRTFDRFSAPIRAEDGEYLGRAWFFHDVTERKRAEDVQRFLAEASDALSASLDYERTLKRVARLAIPALADACVVYMANDDGSISRMAIEHSGPEGLEEALEGRIGIDSDAEEGVPKVIRTGRFEYHPEATPELLSADVDDPEALRTLIEPIGVHSWMCVPMSSSGRTFGAISFIRQRSQRRYTPEDLALAQELARRAAIAIENARLYREAEETRTRLTFLAEASEVLSASLNYYRTLSKLARLTVPKLADWCSVEVLGEDGSSQQVAVAHVDPEKVKLARHLRERYPPDPDAERGVPYVLRTGEPELYPEITDELLVASARDEEHLRVLRELQLRSYMVLPLVARGRTLGALTLISAESGRRYGPSDLAFAQELARRAAVAIDNARLYQERSRVARTLQQSLLPPALPEIPGVELAARYEPAGEATDVGGDFYDAFEMGSDAWAVLIGDVCGKGVEAASLTGLARHTLRAAAIEHQVPTRVLTALNEAVRRSGSEDRFCTVCYVRLERVQTGLARATVACGGHPLPLVLRGDGRVETAGEPGTLLGVLPQPEVTERQIDLRPGDTLVLYTDGVTERRADDELFGEHRLRSLLSGCVGLSAEEVATSIERAAIDFAPGDPRDDMAILVARVTDGEAAEPARDAAEATG